MAVPKKPTMITSPLVSNGEKNTIPQDTPLGSNAFSVSAGFPPITSTPIQAGGIPPDRLDFNGVFNLLSQHTFFLESGNKYDWSDKLDYMTGATVLGSDNALYYCIQANGASEPNTVQDPTSSSGYWVKLINNDGKVNADNLSVVLGSFAQLNSLGLADNKLTGVLPISKGGSGANNLIAAQNNLGIFQRYYVSSGTEFTDLNNLVKLGNGEFIGNGTWTANSPSGTWGICLQYYHRNADCRQLFLDWNGSTFFRRASTSETSGIFSPWVKISNSDGSIPITAGGTGLTVGAFPTVRRCVLLKNWSGSSNVGDCVFWGPNDISSPGGIEILPAGGTWFIVRMPFGANNIIPFLRAGGTQVSPDGGVNRMGYAVRIK